MMTIPLRGDASHACLVPAQGSHLSGRGMRAWTRREEQEAKNVDIRPGDPPPERGLAVRQNPC